MKYLIFFSAVLLVSCATTVVPVTSSAPNTPADPKKENWTHVFDAKNQIAASVNTVNQEVIYYQSADVAFRSLFAAMLKQFAAAQEAKAKEDAAKAPVGAAPKGKK